MDVEFGQYRLKRQERLLIGPIGPVELSSRSFDILTVLLDKPNELIGKPALLDAVWPGWPWKRTRCRSTFRRCERRWGRTLLSRSGPWLQICRSSTNAGWQRANCKSSADV